MCPTCVSKLINRANGKRYCKICKVTYEQQELFTGAESKPPKGKRTKSQIGRAARAKGMNAQNEFKKIVGGAVVPLSGASGGDFSNDIHLWNTWQGEIKRFASGELTLYKWLNDEREKPDFVAFRADKMPWVVSMHVDKFNRLLDVQKAASKLLELTEDNLPMPYAFAEFMCAVESLRISLEQSTRKSMMLSKEKLEKIVNSDG